MVHVPTNEIRLRVGSLKTVDGLSPFPVDHRILSIIMLKYHIHLSGVRPDILEFAHYGDPWAASLPPGRKTTGGILVFRCFEPGSSGLDAILTRDSSFFYPEGHPYPESHRAFPLMMNPPDVFPCRDDLTTNGTPSLFSTYTGQAVKVRYEFGCIQGPDGLTGSLPYARAQDQFGVVVRKLRIDFAHNA